MSLARPADILVGRLGQVHFPAGTYAYTGSGMGGLDARVARHFLPEKKVHWHIDYLLLEARPLRALLLEGERREECLLNGLVECLSGARPVAPGFGCSDCRCDTHLHRLDRAALASLEGIFEYHDRNRETVAGSVIAPPPNA